MRGAIGIDAGSTNVKAVVIDDRGRVCVEAHQPTRSRERTHAQTTRDVLTKVLSKIDDPPRALGVAAPGLAARDERSIALLPGRQTDLEGLNWTQMFDWPTAVPVLNDGHAALVGEAWCGAAAGCRNVVLLTLGTGVGGAVMVDGRLLRGTIGRAGHVGHMCLDLHGPPDVLNVPGSLEDQLSEATVVKRTGGRYTSNRDVALAARRGDAQAAHDWRQMVHALACGVVSLINIIDPEVVVIGGGFSLAGDDLLAPLRREMNDMEWRPLNHRVRVVAAALGPLAGAIGAARQAMEMHGD